jgi:hypothetical protein
MPVQPRVRTLLKILPDFVLHSLRHTFGTRMCPGGEIGRRNGLKIKPRVFSRVAHD